MSAAVPRGRGSLLLTLHHFSVISALPGAAQHRPHRWNCSAEEPAWDKAQISFSLSERLQSCSCSAFPFAELCISISISPGSSHWLLARPARVLAAAQGWGWGQEPSECQMPDRLDGGQRERWLRLRVSGDNDPGELGGCGTQDRLLLGVWWDPHKGIKAELVLSLFALPALGVLVKVLQNTSQALSPEFPRVLFSLPGGFLCPSDLALCAQAVTASWMPHARVRHLQVTRRRSVKGWAP